MITQKDFENIAKIINKNSTFYMLFGADSKGKQNKNAAYIDMNILNDLSIYFKSQNAKFKADRFKEMCLK